MNTQKHLTLESRNIIEIELGKGTSFRKIARILHKDPTTISKEIRAHIRHEKTGAFSKSFNDCLHNAHYVMFARCVPIENDFAGPVVYVMKNAVYMRNILVLSLKSHHMFVILVNLRPTAR